MFIGTLTGYYLVTDLVIGGMELLKPTLETIMVLSTLMSDIFKSTAQALVNPVNCAGVMGKGLALQFREKFPYNFIVYRKACESGRLKPGIVLPVKDGEKFIINFPTKRHWRDKSRMEDIESGLANLLTVLKFYEITSVAIPKIGCGLGGLDWADVKPLVVRTFEGSGIKVLYC